MLATTSATDIALTAAIHAKLAAMVVAPRTHNVVTLYEGGDVRTFAAHSLAAANNHAERESRKIGRDLISRETGETVRVCAVYVETIN